jgi:hypothetical protein
LDPAPGIHSPSPRLSTPERPQSPNSHAELTELLRDKLTKSDISLSPVFALLLAISEEQPHCFDDLWFYLQVVDQGAITTVDALKLNLQDKNVITKTTEHRAAELMEAFRD